jgi:Domain of unknown function (DUF4129)
MSAGHASLPLALLAVTAAAPVDRDEARDAAEHELSKGIYHADDPNFVERAIESVLRWLGDRLDDAAGLSPGGPVGLVAGLVLVATIVALVLWRFGPLRRMARLPAAETELSGSLTADDHRRLADAHAADSRYAEAVRERMRAIVRELETRGVLEPRPGRTADEVAREAGDLIPAIAAELRTAARIFDEVWFGGRPATPGADAAMREADQRVRTAQLAIASASGAADGTTGYRVPR